MPEGAKVKKASFGETYYVSFGENRKSAEVTAYIAKVKFVSVNGTLYTRIDYSGNVYDKEDSFATTDIAGNNGKHNAISISGSKMTGVKDKVIVQAEGYSDLVLSYPSASSRVRRSLLEDPFLEESLDSEEEKSETLGVNTTEHYASKDLNIAEFSAIDGTSTVESAETADTKALNKEETSEERSESAENSAE